MGKNYNTDVISFVFVFLNRFICLLNRCDRFFFLTQAVYVGCRYIMALHTANGGIYASTQNGGLSPHQSVIQQYLNTFFENGNGCQISITIDVKIIKMHVKIN